MTEGDVTSVAFSPDGKTLAAGYAAAGGVVLWDVATRKRLVDGAPPREGGRRSERGLQPRRQDPRRRIRRCDGDGGVVLWDVARAQAAAPTSPSPVKEGDRSERGLQPRRQDPRRGVQHRLQDCRHVGGVVLWDVARGGTSEWPRRRDQGLQFAAWPSAPTARPSPPDTAWRRRRAAWCCGTRPRASGWRESPSPVTEGDVRSVAFSPDGKTLAAGYAACGSGGVVLWDAAGASGWSTKPLPVTEGDRSERGLQPRRQDPRRRIRRCGGGGGVVLWDVAARERLAAKPLAREGGRRSERGLQPRRQDPRRRIRDGSGGGVVLWDAAHAQRLATKPLAVKEGDVRSVAFSPDGKTLAAGYDAVGRRGGVVLWDAADASGWRSEPPRRDRGLRLERGLQPRRQDPGRGIQRRYDGGVVLWDVDLESWQRLAGQIANRNFTRAEWQRVFPRHALSDQTFD